MEGERHVSNCTQSIVTIMGVKGVHMKQMTTPKAIGKNLLKRYVHRQATKELTSFQKAPESTAQEWTLFQNSVGCLLLNPTCGNYLDS